MEQTDKKWVSILILIALGLGGVGLAMWMHGCASAPIATLEEAEYITWRNARTGQIATIARGAYEEGDVSAETLEIISSGLAAIASSGNGDVTAFVDALGLKGYQGASLKIALQELSIALGSTIDGALGERAKDTLNHLAAKLSAIAP